MSTNKITQRSSKSNSKAQGDLELNPCNSNVSNVTHDTNNTNMSNMTSTYSHSNNSYNYNPVMQTNFDLDPLIPSDIHKTSSIINHHHDIMNFVAHAGTSQSRKGKYIPPSWQQTYKRIRSRSVCLLAAFLSIAFFLNMAGIGKITNNHDTTTDDSTTSGMGIGMGIDEEKNHSQSNKNNDTKGDYSNSDNIFMNDYTYLDTNILHQPLHKQQAIIDKIPKTCLRSPTPSSPCYDQCPIQNPFIGQHKLNNNSWKQTLNMNHQLIKQRNNYERKIWDVVFYGDSIIEQWNGRWMGTEMDSKQEIKEIFRTYFDASSNVGKASISSGSSNIMKRTNNNDTDAIDGLALGIAGDTTSNLLWRLQSGEELPIELQAKVFWVLIGTNDLTLNCSEDIVVLGILSIVQELQSQRPDSIIVINGLLPRSNYDVNGSLSRSEEFTTHSEQKGPESSTFYYWPSIQAINEQLKQYAWNHDRVEFFDPSEIFVAHIGNSHFTRRDPFLMKELQDDFLHPSALGHQIWAEVRANFNDISY
jgi:lysophospholipase L1-like esterase